MTHAITLRSDAGEALRFANMTIDEGLGRLFDGRLEAISTNVQLDLIGLLGSGATVRVETPQGYVRYVDGIVIEAEQGAFVKIDNVRYAVYHLRLAPRPWLLTRTSDCRIYKNMSVPDIVKQVLGEFGYGDVRNSLTGQYPVREYCVQYRQSYFDFLSHLMEQEGIYYYFTHAEGSHTMVLADSLGAHVATPGFESIAYAPPTERGSRMTASIAEWNIGHTVNPTRVTLDDYDYLRPSASLHAEASVTDAQDTHRIDGLDVYEYPYRGAGYSQSPQNGQRYAQAMVDAMNAGRQVSGGVTDAVGLASGALFRLRDFPVQSVNDEYLVVGTSIRLVEVDYQAGGGEPDMHEAPFTCDFRVIRGRQPYRMPQTTPRPLIHGLQTAVVYGATDEDIAVDKYGRVQVRFFWNPPSKPHADQSCFVRVASHWAGKRWGAVQIPRVGQEVVVSFLDGDPDRPLIIGSVYNQEHMPPYPLPEERTRSGVVSRSLLGGPDEANEIRFEDRKGAEELYFHAQRDLRHEAENDHFSTIDRDETENVKRNRDHTVGVDDTLHVGRNLSIVAGEQIEIRTGAASIVMRNTGQITITCTELMVEAAATINMTSAAATTIEAGGDASVGAGGLVNVTAGGAVTATAGGAVTATAGGAVALTAGGAIAATAGAAVAITAAAAVGVTAGAALMLTAAGPAVLTGDPPLLA